MGDRSPYERELFRGGADDWDTPLGNAEGLLFFGRSVRGGPILVHLGSSNVLKDVKWWNGAEYLVKPLKVYVGGAWVFCGDGQEAPPEPALPFNVGYQSAGSATFPSSDGRYLATQIVLTRPSKLRGIRTYTNAAGGTITPALWDGSTGEPTTILSVGSATANAGGWVDCAISDEDVLQPGRYWVGHTSNGFYSNFGHNLTPNMKYARREGGSIPPVDFGTVAQVYESRGACYGVFEPVDPVAGKVIVQITQEMLSKSAVGAGSHTYANAFDNALTPGNSVVVKTNVYTEGGPGLSAVTIGGATATKVSSHAPNGSTVVEVWVATVGSSPNRDIVITVPAGGWTYYPTISGLECSPLAASPLDFEVHTSGSNNTPTVTAAGNTAQANTLVLSQWGPNYGVSDIAGNEQGSPSTWLPWSYQKDSNTYQGGSMACRVLDAVSTPTVSWSKTSSGDWFTSMVALKFAT